jgi:hypothetical protein
MAARDNILSCADLPQGYDDDGNLSPPYCPSNEITQLLGLATVWCGDTTANLEPAAVAAIAATPVLLVAAAAGIAL